MKKARLSLTAHQHLSGLISGAISLRERADQLAVDSAALRQMADAVADTAEAVMKKHGLSPSGNYLHDIDLDKQTVTWRPVQTQEALAQTGP